MDGRWTGRSGWVLTDGGDRLTLTTAAGTEEFEGADAARLRVAWRWFRRCLVIDGEPRRYLPGVRLRDSRAIRAAHARVVARGRVRGAIALAASRAEVFERLLATRVRKQRWIAYDDAAAILAGLPRPDAVLAALTPAQRDALAHALSPSERRALAFLSQDHLARVNAANEEIARREILSGRAFFDSVERSPLTEEQARAVVSMDNRVRVIAAAGSGKTSVMVARAAYAIRRGFVSPDRILMLAFNADAADELRERTTASLDALGLPSEGLTVATFHAFGLSVIGEATGSRPRIAPWLESGRDAEKVVEIARALGAEDAQFAAAWNRLSEGGDGERTASTVRSLMTRAAAADLTVAELAARLHAAPGGATARTRDLATALAAVTDRWDAELRAAGAVDFDGMLTRAAEALESDPTLARYNLILVDEFQDTSRARARLVRALLRERGTYLLAVGDDWQAINRFAGADVTLMTDFGAFFGPALTRRLESTFRTPQTIADVAARFVTRNPTQIAKAVRSVHAGGAPVAVVRVPRADALTSAIAAHLAHLAEVAPGSRVEVLGRYGFDEKLVPARRPATLDVRFRTVHRSKGLETDHVILPNMVAGSYGFPSIVPEDPALALAQPGGDDFPHAEERRLLYVALTRARRTVTLFTVTGRESAFVTELLEDPDVEVRDADVAMGERPARAL